MCVLLVASSGLVFSARIHNGNGALRSDISSRTPRVLATGLQSHLPSIALQVNPFFPIGANSEPRPPLEEDTEGRSDWFTFQRIYGSNSIPPDARLKAWNADKQFQLNSAFVPQASQTWRPIGPTATVSAWYPFWGLTSGRVNAVAVSPASSSIVLIGSSTGGIWRSTDAGETFAPVSDDQVDLAVGSIAFSKSNPTIAFAGMGDTKAGYLGSGVLKSTDAGRTWERVSNNSLPSPGTIAKLEIDPANPDRIYVAQYSTVSGSKIVSSGLYVSTDGGVRWKRVLDGAPRDVIIHPNDAQVLYAGLSRIDKDNDPPFGLYRSTDSGATWSNVFTAPQYDLKLRRDFRVAISPVNPQLIYTYFGGFAGSNLDARLRVSTDAGATWIDRSLAAVDTAFLGYNTYLVADPRDALTVYIGSRDLYKSTDGGESWSNLTCNFFNSGFGFQYAPGGSATHTDQHAIAFSPANPDEYYLGNDGGVSKTTDNGNTFRSLNATLTLTQFIGITQHPTIPEISYGGTQDNGTQLRSTDSNWYEVLSGDGGRVVINPLDPGMVFMTYVRGDIFRVVNNGQSLDVQVGSNATFGEFFQLPRIAFYPPFVGNGVDSTLYFGSWRLFVSTNLGNSWVAPAGFLDLTKGVTDNGPDVLSAIAVARSNTNVIYTGSAQGRAMRSTNGGQSWADMPGLPDRSITSIAADPDNASIAYMTVSGFNSGHVFKTTNTGGSWVDISGSLPDVPANALLVDPSDPTIVYLGTDIGIFRSASRGSDWRLFNKGMPPVVVHGFSANGSGMIQAATYGRGAYELGGPADRPTIIAVNFSGKKRLTIDGSGFGEAPRVIINGEDRSGRITERSESAIVVIGKLKKLGLKGGDNLVQIITSDNLSSNIFTIPIAVN